jgi:SAM-dependent methyltransferase
MLRAFLRWNRTFCNWLEGYLPTARRHTFRVYPQRVAQRLTPGVEVVLDVGGGKACAYADQRPPQWTGRVIALDIAIEELAVNDTAEDKIIADGVRGLPFRAASIDLITSRSVLEHLNNLEAFVEEAARVLRPGGYFVHWIPCRYAPFAVVNRLLPNWLGKRLVHFTDPASVGICGFPAVYDRCYPAALRQLLARHGFSIEELTPSYFQARYYAFFAPLFLISTAYELAVQALGIETLCAHMLVVARRN